jgi:hypothetical protein
VRTPSMISALPAELLVMPSSMRDFILTRIIS